MQTEQQSEAEEEDDDAEEVERYNNARLAFFSVSELIEDDSHLIAALISTLAIALYRLGIGEADDVFEKEFIPKVCDDLRRHREILREVMQEEDEQDEASKAAGNGHGKQELDS